MAAIAIRPQEGPQEVWLSSPADIAVFGGGAGGGKTFGLLLEGLRHTSTPGFEAVLFRRTNADIRKAGALWDSSREIYSQTSAKPREQYLDWTFPSGASISLSGLQYENDIYDWQGAQICLLAFDELTHFSRKQFFYMLSRNRSTCGIKPYVRATLNPDPDSWVFELLGPWVNPEHPHFGAVSGEILWFIYEDDEIRWVSKDHPDSLSITFVAALVTDNPALLKKDPDYVRRLKALPGDERDRLLRGLWTALEAKGALWKREWIDRDRVTPAKIPNMLRIVVAVDPAASSDPNVSDETGIVVVGQGTDKHFYTLADLSGHYRPKEWAEIAIAQFHKWGAARIVAEKNQGGEMVENTIHTIERVPVVMVHAKVGKEVRAAPVAVVAEAGKDHHVGKFSALEGQMTRWVPGQGNASPDRLDAKVYAILDLDPTLEKPTYVHHSYEATTSYDQQDPYQ